jgi:hypothetical protein
MIWQVAIGTASGKWRFRDRGGDSADRLVCFVRFVSLMGRGVRMHPFLADDQPVRGDQVSHLSVFLPVRLAKVGDVMGDVNCKTMGQPDW